LLVVSPRSLDSEWVKDELFWAIDNRPDRIIPVVIGQCSPADFHIRLRRIQPIDFVEDPVEGRSKLLAALRDESDTD
jgi:hypothetical protein